MRLVNVCRIEDFESCKGTLFDAVGIKDQISNAHVTVFTKAEHMITN